MYIEENTNRVGRPKEVKGRRRGFNVSFYVDDVIMEALEEIHWREHKSISELVRMAVEEWAANHKEGNETFKIDEWVDDPEFFAVPALDSSNEKWIKYIKECNNKELTKIGSATSYIHGLVKLRRDKEFRDRENKK